MKKINVLKFVLPILGISAVAALTGSITSTLAWYAYSTRALVSYSGTSVSSTTQLQIGVKSEKVINFGENANLIEDVTYEGDTYNVYGVDDPATPEDESQNVLETKPYHYYFMKRGAGGMPFAIINEYLAQNGYTTNILEPVSSYTYANSNPNAFHLQNRPITNKPFADRTDALKTQYLKISFVFRILGDSSATPTYVKNQKIFLSSADAVPKTTGKIDKSLRLYIDRTNGANYLLNPNSTTDGATKVSGVLDLSSDGYFDYDNNPASATYNREYLYGDYTFEEGYSWETTIVPEASVLAESSDYVDINNSGDATQTTFTSRHYRGVRYFSDLSHIISGQAEYLGTNTVYPTKDNNGDLQSDYAVCQTSNDDRGIGTFDLVVYLEGWDFSVVDSELKREFYLGLTFETNVVK